jgi:hypothetical protein
MADVYLWGKINHIGPGQFYVTAACGTPPGDAEPRAELLERIASSRAEAEELRSILMMEACERARARGDQVVDVDDA